MLEYETVNRKPRLQINDEIQTLLLITFEMLSDRTLPFNISTFDPFILLENLLAILVVVVADGSVMLWLNIDTINVAASYNIVLCTR